MSKLVKVLLKVGFIVFGVLSYAHAQTTTTYTGIVKDLTQNPITSGQVTFTLTLPNSSTIPGIGTFVPTTVLCNINTDGTLSGFVAGVVSGACSVTMNTALSPTGTAYKVCIQPNYQTPGSCFFDYAVTSSKDISTVVPTLPTGPINYGAAIGPPGPTGPAGPAGTVSATGVNGNFLVPGMLSANVNRWQSPTTQGIISQGSLNTILATGTAASGSLNLSAASDFVVGNGVMIAHAGAACGSVKGGNCSSPPTPVVTVKGTPGSTSYSYKLACIDGLGGIGTIGTGVATTSGNATLAGVVLANTVSGNYNEVSWSGNSACFEVAIYRNNSLIATEYSAPSGTMKYNDIGVAAWTNRDLPSTPPGSSLNDNYVGIISAIGSTTATVSPVLGASVSGVTLYHSDTPLIQAAITAASASSVDLGANIYLVNYPINFTKRGGVLTGASNLIADTGDILMDLTGDNFGILKGFSIVPGTTNLSSIGIYCARDTTVSSDFAQTDNTDHIIIANLSNNPHVLGGRGSVGYYNHACEIQQHLNPHIEADRPFVLTANNIDHVSSVFDSHDDQTSQSMSAIDIITLGAGASGPFIEFDQVFSVNVTGGFGDGRNSAAHPWSFEFDTPESGRIKLDGFRTENKAGGVYIAGQLAEPYIDMDVYRANQTTAQVFIAAGGSLVHADMVRVDDYGASSVPGALIDGGAGCNVQGSNIRIGVQQTLGTCPLSGAGNTITGLSIAVPAYDYSVNPDYTLVFATSTTWVKLGTWVSNAGGDTLDIRLYSGAGDNVAANQQALADLIVRNANGASAPNLSGASLLSYGNSPFLGVKVVATGASTSPTNLSWDVYVQEMSFAQGTYHIEKQNTSQWINSNTIASDPGAPSSTVVVGNIKSIVAAPSGTVGFTGSCAPTTTLTVVAGIITGCV